MTATKELTQTLADLFYDPLGFVIYVFSWGEGDLLGEAGPSRWQEEILVDLGIALKKQAKEGGALRFAIRSGHGVGKTVLMVWLILFFMVTRPDIQVIATANTETQLKTKLWRELAKWHRRAIIPVNKMFEWTATRLISTESPEDWYATAIPWSKDNPEAMAGAHDKTVLYLFDEASGIHECIWETAEGALTDGGGVLVAAGNPTKNTGEFNDCFEHTKKSKFWDTRTINGEKVDRVDRKLLADWREMYGAESDFYRVRALGLPPKHGTSQFISKSLVEEAMERKLPEEAHVHHPTVLGIDVARFGPDRTVFTLRQGPKLLFQEVYRGLDTWQTGERAGGFIVEHNPDCIFVDVVGIGSGVVDHLVHSTHTNIIAVNGGHRTKYPELHRNMRGDCWGDMKDWLRSADIPEDDDLKRDLTVIEYSFDTKMRYILDTKEEMRKRGETSPDLADSLALTFASPVALMGFYEEDEEPEELRGASATTGY